MRCSQKSKSNQHKAGGIVTLHYTQFHRNFLELDLCGTLPKSPKGKSLVCIDSVQAEAAAELYKIIRICLILGWGFEWAWILCPFSFALCLIMLLLKSREILPLTSAGVGTSCLCISILGSLLWICIIPLWQSNSTFVTLAFLSRDCWPLFSVGFMTKIFF